MYLDVRDVSRWTGFTDKKFLSALDFVENVNASPVLGNFTEQGLLFDVLSDINPTSNIGVVFFQGAVDREKAPLLPNFTGVSFLRNFTFSKVYFSDPALYLDKKLRLAWYSGTADCDIRSIIRMIVDGLVKRFGWEKVIFVGGSGGGFAALHFSALFADSLAVVWNPQTNILDYSPSHVEDYASICHNSTVEGLKNSVALNLLDQYKFGHSNYVLYLQNSTDWHVRAHLRPFLRALRLVDFADDCAMALSERFFLVKSREWGEGHIPPPPEYLAEQIAKATSGETFRNLILKSRFA